MKHFIFDVDGTLTPSRGIIDLEFKAWFNSFCLTHNVYLVTGSDKPKTVEQISEGTYNLCKRVYNCSGSETWEQDTLVYASDWTLAEGARRWLEGYLTSSKFIIRTGNHLEQRRGLLNFSIVGRNANNEERYFYCEFDEATGERERIARDFNETFPALQATVGGQTGIDIAPRGHDKSQILRDFPEGELHFFGDDMNDPVGNDYSLAQAIVDKKLGAVYNIQNWKDTWNYLQTL
jgi:phosphomannomutase